MGLRSEVSEGLGKSIHMHMEQNVGTTSLMGKPLQKMVTSVKGHRENK